MCVGFGSLAIPPRPERQRAISREHFVSFNAVTDAAIAALRDDHALRISKHRVGAKVLWAIEHQAAEADLARKLAETVAIIRAHRPQPVNARLVAQREAKALARYHPPAPSARSAASPLPPPLTDRDAAAWWNSGNGTTPLPAPDMAQPRGDSPVTLQSLVNAASAGATIDVSGDDFDGSGSGEYTGVNKACHIIGTGSVYLGEITVDGWGNPCIGISANDVEIEGFDIDGAGSVFKMVGKYYNFHAHDLLINRNRHKGGLMHWADAGGPSDALFENIHFENGSNSSGSGYLAGRSSEATPCSAFAEDCTFRDCYFKGVAPGWFGVEIRCARRFLLQRCTFDGIQSVSTSWPESDTIEFDDCDWWMNMGHTGNQYPYMGIEQAGNHAFGYHVHNSRVHNGFNVDSGSLISANSITWASHAYPVTTVECVTFVNQGTYTVTEGLSKSLIRNNTIPAGTDVEYLAGGGGANTLSNNDADGASHADCAAEEPTLISLTGSQPSAGATVGAVNNGPAPTGSGNSPGSGYLLAAAAAH